MLSVLPAATPIVEDATLVRFGDLAKGRASTIDDIVAEMDHFDIEFGVLGGAPVNFDVYRPGPRSVGTGMSDEDFDISCRAIAGHVAAHPSRLKGFVRLDPSDCMGAVRRLERAVRDYGIGIAQITPSVVGLPPNDPSYFPVYAKCAELAVVLRVNLGMPGPSHRAELQEPILLDEVLLTFPGLILVGAHLGHPWVEQVLALLRKYPNFFLLTSGWAPSQVPQAIWDFAESARGSEKVMWASDFPLLPIGRCATEGRGLRLSAGRLRRYLRENAVDVFRLADSPTVAKEHK